MSKEKRIENSNKYAKSIAAVINDIFHYEESKYYIDPEELKDSENMTDFCHALLNTAPHFWFNKITGTEGDPLEYNHIANRLCIQYINQNDE